MRVLLLKLGVKLERGEKEKQLFEKRTVCWKALRHVRNLTFAHQIALLIGMHGEIISLCESG